MAKQLTSVLLERDVLLKLKAISRSTNKSTTYLISEAVTEFITRKTSNQKINIIGIADSKDPGFAREDERYLKESGFGED